MRLLVIAWLAFVVGISLLPYPAKIFLGTTGAFHKIGHYATFAITAAILCWGTAGLRRKLTCSFAALSLAVVLETIEAVQYHNPIEWRDLVLDAAGILSGFLFVTVIVPKALATQGRARK